MCLNGSSEIDKPQRALRVVFGLITVTDDYVCPDDPLSSHTLKAYVHIKHSLSPQAVDDADKQV